MRPRVGCRNLVSRLKQVVLPAPFGPISAWMVPRATRSATPRTATKPANSLVRSSVSRIASVLADNDVPSPRALWWRQGSRPRLPDQAGRQRSGSIAAWQPQYDVGREVAGDCRGSERGPQMGARPAVGDRPGGGVGSTRGWKGGARADLI